MIYFLDDRKVILITLLSMLLLVGMQRICYSQKVSETDDEVMSASELRGKVLPTVVYIKTKKGAGSGVVIKTSEDDTFVLTNEHVTTGSDKVEVFFLAYDARGNEIREKEFYFGSQHSTDILRRLGYATDGRVVVEDKEADVAVIVFWGYPKTVESILLKYVDLYDHLKVGDMVHFLGHPGDQELLWQWNLGQFKRYEDRGLLLEGRAYKGNSGGPLLNKKGELIGLIKRTDDITKIWAVPLEPIIDLVNGLKEWDIISILNETETDVVYEVNWIEAETWERIILEPRQWKVHRHPTDADRSFQIKIRYVSTRQQTPQEPVDTDTKKPEEPNDKKPEEQDDRKPKEQDDKNDENIVNNEHELRYIKRQFFSSDDTERIKPKLDGYDYRFVSLDSMKIEFQEKRQTVWIANHTEEMQKYSIRWSADRFDEDTYSLEPGKAKPHWSTRTILGLAANYPKISFHYYVSNSAALTKQWGIFEKTLKITKKMQFFRIDTKPDEHIIDIEELRKTIKDNIEGYYHLQTIQNHVVPEIREGLPVPEKEQTDTSDTPENEQTDTSDTPENEQTDTTDTPENEQTDTTDTPENEQTDTTDTPENEQTDTTDTPENEQTDTTDTPENEQTDTSKKSEKWIIPIILGITVIGFSVIVVFAIHYYYPRRHIFSIENNTDSTVDFHIKWTKKTDLQLSSLEPGKSQIYLCPGFFKKKPLIHFAQIVNYAKEVRMITLETRSQRYRRSATTQNYQEIAHKYDFDYNEADEIQLFDSEE